MVSEYSYEKFDLLILEMLHRYVKVSLNLRWIQDDAWFRLKQEKHQVYIPQTIAMIITVERGGTCQKT